MDNSQKQNLAGLNHEKIGNLNRLVTSKDIQSIIRYLLTKDQVSSSVNSIKLFYKTGRRNTSKFILLSQDYPISSGTHCDLKYLS